MMEINDLSYKVIGLALEIHKDLGPGLLESAYKECLYQEILRTGLFAQKERPIPLVYRGIKMDCGYRIDIVVENSLVIEVKSLEAIHDVHYAQLLTYLKLGNFKLGLMLNFNTVSLREGIKRMIN